MRSDSLPLITQVGLAGLGAGEQVDAAVGGVYICAGGWVSQCGAGADSPFMPSGRSAVWSQDVAAVEPGS